MSDVRGSAFSDDFDQWDVEVSRRYQRIPRAAYPYHCGCCNAGLNRPPHRKDPETGVPLGEACYQFRIRVLTAKREKADNRRYTVKPR